MANVYAVKSGNWSDTTLWNISALPATVDDVYANGFTVYVNQDIDVLSLRNTASAPIVAGGTFILNHGVVAQAKDVYCGTNSTIQFISAAPNFATFVGSATGSTTTGLLNTILNNSTGTLNISGDVYATTNASINSSGGARNNAGGVMNLYGRAIGVTGVNQPPGIFNQAGTLNIFGDVLGSSLNALSYGCLVFGGTVNIVGNIDGRIGGRAVTNRSTTSVINITGNITSTNGFGIWCESAPVFTNIIGNVSGGSGSGAHGIQTGGTGGVINIIGNVFGGSGSSAYGINATTSGVIMITGNVIGGNGSTAYGVANTATGYMEVNGTAIGNAWGLGSSGIGGATPGIFGSQTGTTIIRGLSCGQRGQWPTAGNVFIIPQNTSTATFETSAFQDVTLFTSLSTNIVPPTSSVRLGTRYNLNDYTGTCAIPSVSSVLQGVAVDNFIGIAALQPQTIWNYSVLSATNINSLGGRLKEVATVQSVGQQLTALN